MAAFSLEDFLFLALALAFNSLTAPMVKFTQDASGQYAYNKWCVYFFAELLKLAVSGGWCAWKYATDPEVKEKLVVERRDIWQYAVPAFVFFTQNNLSFPALQHMSNSAFQLLLNTRIAAVAIMQVFVLGKPLNRLEWAGIVLLTNGAVQFQLAGMGRAASNTKVTCDFVGLMLMGVIVLCASGGNVATQLVMQRKADQPLALQNSLLYIWGIAFNGINWWSSVMGLHSGTPEPWFGNIGRIQVTSILFYAAYGLSISVILKRFGAVTRTLVSCVAIVCTALMDWSWFGVRLTLLEASTFLTIFISIFLHSILGPDYAIGGAKAVRQLQEGRGSSPTPDVEKGTSPQQRSHSR